MSDDAVGIDFKPAASVQSTSLVAYESRGHCLVIAATTDAGLEVIEKLDAKAATLLVPDAQSNAPQKQATEHGVKVITVNALELTGHLGAYDCTIGSADAPGSLAKLAGVSLLGGFDTVLDLLDTPLLKHEVLPFGYFAPCGDESLLQKALSEIPDLDGEFEKPKYFTYDAAICAHSRSGITACTNCLDVCATGAIHSAGEGIAVDPYLCQGCGSCASSCPSGAMTYAYPQPADALAQLASLITDHARSGNAATVVFFHDADEGAERLQSFSAELHPAVLPVAVEEVGSIGLDGWFSALAFGASYVLIDAPTAGGSMHTALESQVDIGNTVLGGLGLDYRIQMVAVTGDGESINQIASSAEATGIPAARFKTFNNKRQTIRMALDHLGGHQSPIAESVSLAETAPFGEISVDSDACTLCMACVTVCPARALQDGDTLPQLKLIESNCLQCGTCEKACPEDAISLIPRFLFDSEHALKPRILNEEKPFNCVVCNKPFATQQIIGRMLTKLSGHWMFEDDKAKRRLKMCEDCRVVDIFESESGGIDVHKS